MLLNAIKDNVIIQLIFIKLIWIYQSHFTITTTITIYYYQVHSLIVIIQSMLKFISLSPKEITLSGFHCSSSSLLFRTKLFLKFAFAKIICNFNFIIIFLSTALQLQTCPLSRHHPDENPSH
jgi:hypothetical protein